jgi:hypothetical protein
VLDIAPAEAILSASPGTAESTTALFTQKQVEVSGARTEIFYAERRQYSRETPSYYTYFAATNIAKGTPDPKKITLRTRSALCSRAATLPTIL